MPELLNLVLLYRPVVLPESDCIAAALEVGVEAAEEDASAFRQQNLMLLLSHSDVQYCSHTRRGFLAGHEHLLESHRFLGLHTPSLGLLPAAQLLHQEMILLLARASRG